MFNQAWKLKIIQLLYFYYFSSFSILCFYSRKTNVSLTCIVLKTSRWQQLLTHPVQCLFSKQLMDGNERQGKLHNSILLDCFYWLLNQVKSLFALNNPLEYKQRL